MKEIRYILLFLLLPSLFVACNDETEPGIPGEARPTMNPQDSLAMVAFYHSMKCAEWKGDFHWDLTDYTTWGGVTAALDTLNNEYRITEIEVPDATTYLPDGYSLPDELGDLTALRSLIVWGDGRRTGGLPETLFNCPLDLLYIQGQDFTRTSLPRRVLSDSFLSCPVVDKETPSLSNPDLLDNWENVDEIALNTDTEWKNYRSTAPWGNGTSSDLSESFRRDIRKEAGWSMPFHTFKEQNVLHCPNYMCFYNAVFATVKVFCHHNGSATQSNGPQWFPMTVDGCDIHLLGKTETYGNLLLFSNRLKTERLNIGWHGFMVQIPRPTIGEVATQIRLQSPSDDSNRAS